MIHIKLVDDESIQRDSLIALLSSCKLEHELDYHKSIYSLALSDLRWPPDVLILDFKMGNTDSGIAFDSLLALKRELRVIVWSGYELANIQDILRSYNQVFPKQFYYCNKSDNSRLVQLLTTFSDEMK